MRTSSTESTASPSWRGRRPSWRSTPHTGDPLATLLAPPEALPAPVAEPATVHREGVAVDVAALFRVGQEGDGSRHVLRLGEATHGGAALYVLVGVAAAGLVLDVHLSLDPAGADGVHPHAASAPLGGQGSREPYESVLARVVRCAIRYTQEPGHRADVHDAPGVLAEHHLPELAAHEKRTGQVHLQEAPPVGERGLLGG